MHLVISHFVSFSASWTSTFLQLLMWFNASAPFCLTANYPVFDTVQTIPIVLNLGRPYFRQHNEYLFYGQ